MKPRGPHYEYAIVILLGILSGIVNLDRLTVVCLFPIIIKEFNILMPLSTPVTAAARLWRAAE